MLTNVKLINFKSHRSTQLNFDDSRLHALVEQNSSGKTSILQALDYLSQIGNPDFEELFIDKASPEFITTVGQSKISVTGQGCWDAHSNHKAWKATYELRKEKVKVNLWSLPVVSVQLGQRVYTNTILDSEDYDAFVDALDATGFALGHTANLKLVAANLARAAYSEAVTPKIEFDGSGLAPTLDYLRDEVPKRFQALQEMLRQIVPGVRKVGIRRAKVMNNRQRLIEVDRKAISYEESQEVVGQEVVLDMNTGDRIPAHAVSEGTMLALGLLTVLMSPEQPNLVLLDDIEQGLHPKAQRELMSVFKQIIQTNPNLQIIFSTHSPCIVDELTPSQVHVLSNTKSGFTRVKRLDEHPHIEWARQTLTTGEFWDAEGEDWVVAGELEA